jgi:CYTH domain-containing protein
MPKEIERKFLVLDDTWRNGDGTPYRQGYLSTVKERTVRVRRAGQRAWLTVKGISRGATRLEFEYEIPVDEADEMLDALCERPLIEKRRYVVPWAGLKWEVDEFFGENAGLILAEVELESEDQAIDRPPWLGREVTQDPRFFNANLVQHPFSEWKEEVAT